LRLRREVVQWFLLAPCRCAVARVRGLTRRSTGPSWAGLRPRHVGRLARTLGRTQVRRWVARACVHGKALRSASRSNRCRVPVTCAHLVQWRGRIASAARRAPCAHRCVAACNSAERCSPSQPLPSRRAGSIVRLMRFVHRRALRSCVRPNPALNRTPRVRGFARAAGSRLAFIR
jgi:hypothetical protein